MPDSSKEKELTNLDGEDKTPKSSNMNDNETKITPNGDYKIENGEASNLEENNVAEEPSCKNDIESDKIQNADSAAATPKDSKPPVSVCFKKTSEVVSKESYVSMLEDINLFFSNLKELESRRTSKRKLNSALEDVDGKSNLSHSEDCVQPTKKLLLDTSTKKAISTLQSPTSEPCRSVAEATETNPENVNSTSQTVASKCKDQSTSDTHHSTESHSSPSTCQAVTSTEVPTSIANQPNSVDLPMETTDAPQRLGNVDTEAISQPEIESEPFENVIMEDYGQPMPEINGVTKHHFPGAYEVAIIVPLFECLLNDLLELRSFLDGQALPPSRSAEETSDVTSPEIIPLDRLLASITEEFGTGVESPTAQTTIAALIEWEGRSFPGEDSEQETSDDPGFQSEYTEESSPDSSTHRINSESNSNKTPESTANQSPSPDPIPSCSKSDVNLQPAKSPQPNPETGSSNPQKELECNISEQSSAKILENTTKISANPTCTAVVPLTDSLRLNSEIDLLRNPSEIASLLRALNAVGIKYFNSCVETVKIILSACLEHGVYFFNRNLVDHMTKTLDMMRRLVALRQECSEMLRKCSDRNSNAGVTYILKVKTHIARSYNQLLVKILALHNNFHEMVKKRLPRDS